LLKKYQSLKTVPVIPTAIRRILSQVVSATKKSVSKIIDHIIIRAEIPALCPVSRVMYLEVIRPFKTLLYRAGELLRNRPAESSTKGVVGSTGMKIPIMPRARESEPPDMSNSLIIFF